MKWQTGSLIVYMIICYLLSFDHVLSLRIMVQKILINQGAVNSPGSILLIIFLCLSLIVKFSALYIINVFSPFIARIQIIKILPIKHIFNVLTYLLFAIAIIYFSLEKNSDPFNSQIQYFLLSISSYIIVDGITAAFFVYFTED